MSDTINVGSFTVSFLIVDGAYDTTVKVIFGMFYEGLTLEYLVMGCLLLKKFKMSTNISDVVCIGLLGIGTVYRSN